MPDAESSLPSKPKIPSKSLKSGGAVDASSDGKKRFEVKKVHYGNLLRDQVNGMLICHSGML